MWKKLIQKTWKCSVKTFICEDHDQSEIIQKMKCLRADEMAGPSSWWAYDQLRPSDNALAVSAVTTACGGEELPEVIIGISTIKHITNRNQCLWTAIDWMWTESKCEIVSEQIIKHQNMNFCDRFFSGRRSQSKRFAVRKWTKHLSQALGFKEFINRWLTSVLS